MLYTCRSKLKMEGYTTQQTTVIREWLILSTQTTGESRMFDMLQLIFPVICHTIESLSAVLVVVPLLVLAHQEQYHWINSLISKYNRTEHHKSDPIDPFLYLFSEVLDHNCRERSASLLQNFRIY